ncbi:alpha/beta hydrolase [Serratia nevei]|uniref:alpha/beta fold hydrolase n=1 Tax=Serratia TaxID=613 RepID=UPI00066A6B54|nr:alpha/beta hydrolase [Serratia marcescens]BEN39862.1 esterase [Serratia marcescens]
MNRQAPLLGHRLQGRGDRGVIVLHGWFGDHTVYEPMMAYLDAASFTYAFADFRGYGASREQTGTYNTDEMVGDIVALADALNWRSFDVVGHSMGGKIAQLIAARHPERVRSAIGLTPVPASGLEVDAEAWRLFERATTDDEHRRMLVDFSTGGRLPPCWVDMIVQRSRAACDQTVFAHYLQSWAKDNRSAETHGCPVPLLLLIGQHDPAQTRPIMEHTCLAWFDNVQLVVLEGSGHYPMQETPVYLTQVIERYLSHQVV